MTVFTVRNVSNAFLAMRCRINSLVRERFAEIF